MQENKTGAAFDLVPVRTVRTMRVGQTTDHTSLAGSITRVWDTSRTAVTLCCLGRDALYQAVRAIPVVNGNLASQGISMLQDVNWSTEPFDPWSQRSSLVRASEQVYQVYEKGGDGVEKTYFSAEGDVVRFDADGPDVADKRWKEHPLYDVRLLLRVLKTVITIRLIPVRRGP